MRSSLGVPNHPAFGRFPAKRDSQPPREVRRISLRPCCTLHRASVGQGLSGPDWLATALGFRSGRVLATGTAWAGLCLIRHHQPASLTRRTATTCPCQTFVVIRDNYCLGRGGVAAEPLRHVVSGGTCDITRRLLWWIWLNLVVLAATGASTRGADSRRPGAAPPFASFFSSCSPSSIGIGGRMQSTAADRLRGGGPS